ncbi:MAG: hypothetical protein K6F86_00560 [Lachnospiraceae bacterium]|nr:hypothetical protein [Lachnospiraceae bacterium]
MKLTGNLKRQVENESTKEGRKKLIEKAGMKLTDEELDKVAGGWQDNTGNDDNPGDAQDGIELYINENDPNQLIFRPESI